MSDVDDTSRRDVLKLLWGATAWTAAGATGFIGIRFLASQQSDSPFGGVISAGLVEDFPPGTVTPFNAGQFYLVRMEDGGFIALYRKCTHLDCIVVWEEQKGHFFCPCHGSVFAVGGDVLNSPAPKPLIHFPVLIDKNGRVKIDTGTLIERKTVSLDDYTYPPEEGM